MYKVTFRERSQYIMHLKNGGGRFIIMCYLESIILQDAPQEQFIGYVSDIMSTVMRQ